MLKYFTLWIVLPCLVAATEAIADTQQEIAHLLNFVSNTTCQYERNGTLHDGVEAQKHIKNKYHYYLDKINSAEEFIRYSATKSTMLGTNIRSTAAIYQYRIAVTGYSMS